MQMGTMVTFTSAELTQCLPFILLDDSMAEDTEFFTVISPSSGAMGIVTITDNDGGSYFNVPVHASSWPLPAIQLLMFVLTVVAPSALFQFNSTIVLAREGVSTVDVCVNFISGALPGQVAIFLDPFPCAGFDGASSKLRFEIQPTGTFDLGM